MTQNPISENEPGFARSPLLMNSHDTALLVIDVQEKLFPLIANRSKIEWNLLRLIQGAQILGLPVLATEQYPQGLGGTIAAVSQALQTVQINPPPTKTMFSCRECQAQLDPLFQQGVRKVLVSGIETHVCVAQTALDLVAAGIQVYLALDAVGSRTQIDHTTAIRRLENSGVTVTTTEAALFEWCESAGKGPFKQISQLVRQTSPEN
jgi:nicotinamidase-related amidase